LVLDYQPNGQWDLGGNLVVVSGSYLHGDENNANQAGGTNGAGAFVSGSGWIPGYAVINLQGTYHMTKYADLFARLANLANKQYATAGFLTSNAFNPNGSFRPDPADWSNENAVSPGQPRAVWAGVRIRWE
jgi:outer membrane receptor protein involved in Fe transport